MDIERFDGTKEREEFDTREAMLKRANDSVVLVTVKNITLHLPKLTVVKKRKRK